MASLVSANVTRAAIVAEARSWIGTPYRHQGSLKGAGCDCLGLIRGVYRVFYGPEKEPITPYSPYWAEESGEETLRDAARRHLVEIDAAPLRDGAPLHAGDVIGHADIETVEMCFRSLAENHETEGIQSLAMPRIAAGLGGLPWEDVKEMIETHLAPLPIPIWVCEV